MNISKYKKKFERIHSKEIYKEEDIFKPILENIQLLENKYSLSSSKFYYSNQSINIHNEKGYLKGIVKTDDSPYIYLSYETLNNKFDKAPNRSLVNLSANSYYRFYLRIKHDETLKVIPYIIHYKDKEKLKLTAIKSYGQLINFSDSDQCRLTFKLIGYGEFEIRNISILTEG